VSLAARIRIVSPSIRPSAQKPAAVRYGSPDSSPRGDRIDAAKHRFPDLQLCTVAILNRRNVNQSIETTNGGGRRKHFRAAHVFAKIALCRDVRHIHRVKIDQLNTRSANGSKLRRHLATNGADTDDGGRDIGKAAVENPKCECRNPKQIQKTKPEIQNTSRARVRFEPLEL